MISSSSIHAARFDIIVDSLEGHRPLHVRLCLEYARSIGAHGVVHVPGSPADIPARDRPLLTMGSWEFADRPLGLDDLAALDTDRVAVLDGDTLARSTFSRRRWPTHAPVVAVSFRGQRPKFGRNVRRNLKSIARFAVAKRLARRPGVTVLTLASSSAPVRPSDGQVRDPVPIECTHDDIERFRERVLDAAVIDEATTWIGVLGIINGRKNVGMVTRAVIDAAGAGELDAPAVLIAGQVKPDARAEVDAAVEALAAAGIPYVLMDHLLDGPTFDAAIGALDMVVTAYSNDGPSAVLGKAARMSTRVVAAGSPTLRADVEALGLGSWGDLSVDGIRSALVSTLRRQPPPPATHLADDDYGRRLLGPPPIRVLAWPAFRHRWGNPFTAELADHLVANGNEVNEFGRARTMLRRHDVILLHWPEFAPTHPSRLVRWVATPVLLTTLALHRSIGGAALVWTMHNVRPHDDPSPQLRRWFMRSLTRHLDGVIALNRTGLHDARTAFPSLTHIEPLITHHPGYTIGKEIDDGTIDSPVSRFLAELDPSVRLLVAWGKLMPYKGLDEVAQLAIRLDDDVVTLIAGRCEDTELAARLERLADDHPARLRVIIGHLDDRELAAVLGRADAAVFNFVDITNSGSVIASLSASVPVIAPNHPGLDELRLELGDDWLRLFDQPLGADELAKMLDLPAPSSPALTELPHYQWRTVGNDIETYVRAVAATKRPRHLIGPAA